MRVIVAVLLLLIMPEAVARGIPVCSWSIIPIDGNWQAPSIPYDVFYLSKGDLREACPNNSEHVRGCWQGSLSYAQIYIDRDLHPSMRHCVLFHEYAHLPPNNWRH